MKLHFNPRPFTRKENLTMAGDLWGLFFFLVSPKKVAVKSSLFFCQLSFFSLHFPQLRQFWCSSLTTVIFVATTVTTTAEEKWKMWWLSFVATWELKTPHLCALCPVMVQVLSTGNVSRSWIRWLKRCANRASDNNWNSRDILLSSNLGLGESTGLVSIALLSQNRAGAWRIPSQPPHNRSVSKFRYLHISWGARVERTIFFHWVLIWAPMVEVQV